MGKILLKPLLLTGWFATSIITLLITINLQKINYEGRGFESLAKQTLKKAFPPYNLYSATPTIISDMVVSLAKGDARPLLLDKFFRRFRSPLAGFGEKIVREADKNNIDWRLLAGIAFQESNLCAKIPKGSYNCWGWAIYAGQNSGAEFRNFGEAIEKISAGVKKHYYDKGLDTLYKMMGKYTPLSTGTWAEGVEYSFALIEE